MTTSKIEDSCHHVGGGFLHCQGVLRLHCTSRMEDRLLSYVGGGFCIVNGF